MNEVYYRTNRLYGLGEEGRLMVFNRDVEIAIDYEEKAYSLSSKFVDLLVIGGELIKIGEL